jgi:hypothetical protein
LKGLKKLEIARPDASQESIEEFLRQIPAAQVNDWAAKFGYTPNQSDK